jgi:hypothetical protein
MGEEHRASHPVRHEAAFLPDGEIARSQSCDGDRLVKDAVLRDLVQAPPAQSVVGLEGLRREQRPEPVQIGNGGYDHAPLTHFEGVSRRAAREKVWRGPALDSGEQRADVKKRSIERHLARAWIVRESAPGLEVHRGDEPTPLDGRIERGDDVRAFAGQP